MNETIEQKALEYFSSGYVCSEAVLKAVAEKHGIDSPLIPAIASGFGSGMARTEHGLCGALSGGIMALSLLQGRKNASQRMCSITMYRRFKSTLKRHLGRVNALLCWDFLSVPQMRA